MSMKDLAIADSYVRRARLQPAMIVALPVAIAALAWSSEANPGWGALWGLFVFCGGTALVAQLARDRGRTKEPTLFHAWGGKPTTRLLRHRDTTNPTLLERRHDKLRALVPGITIPTVEQEGADPESADTVYDACTAFLLEKTRKKDDFPLVFEENCNYGFRRNLWGMKPLGVVISLGGTVAVVLLLIANLRSGVALSPMILACTLVNLSLFLGWLVWIKPTWVRIPAEAYAERLLAACDTL